MRLYRALRMPAGVEESEEGEKLGLCGGNEILDDLCWHGSLELHHAVSTVCRQKGWIDSPDEPARPLALVIEDHEDVVTIFANALQGTGFEIEIVRSGDMALIWLAETTPAVVILDLLLPKVPGAEILRRIRADARLAGVYVIVTTAYPDMAATLNSKADQTFFKPVSYVQLHDLATQLIQQTYFPGETEPVEFHASVITRV